MTYQRMMYGTLFLQMDTNFSSINLQLADPLTKNMDSSLLRAVLEQGSFQLFDEAPSLQTNAHRKQALQWLKESHRNRVLGV